MKNIEKTNLKDMLHINYKLSEKLEKEMKRIQGIKCPADIDMVKDHSKTLKDLDKRTIRIEAGIAVAVFLIMALGGWEYFKDRKNKEADTQSRVIEQIAGHR
jgi:hypothetical protein